MKKWLSLLLALAIRQESFSWLKVAGMAIVLFGLTVAQRNGKRKEISSDAVQ